MKPRQMQSDHSDRSSRAGWTLLELMVVIALMGMLMAGARLVLKNALSVNRDRADRDAVLLWDKTGRSSAKRFGQPVEIWIDWRPQARLRREIRQNNASSGPVILDVPTLVDLQILEQRTPAREQVIRFDRHGRSSSYALKFQTKKGESSWVMVIGETGQAISGLKEQQINELARTLQ